MQATLTQDPRYNLQVGDTQLTNLRIKSQWNGIFELVTPDNKIVILDTGKVGMSLPDTLHSLFKVGPDEVVGQVIRMSVGLVPTEPAKA